MTNQSKDQSKVPPDSPVVTIDGFCDKTTLETVVKGVSSGCKSVMTRRQFEQLVDAIGPNMASPFRHELATAIPRMLLFAKKAKEMGLDTDPRYTQIMTWSSLQMLANHLTLQMQKEAADISDADMEKYYKDNPAKFQECELLRIFIPRSSPKSFDSPSSTNNQENAAEEAAMKAEAEKIQAKAAAGGDFQALQQEAYDAMEIKLSLPKVSLGKRTPASLPQAHQKVCDLQPGQVSELVSDPNGFYVYRVVSKQSIPLTQAKDQIRKTLESERIQASVESLFGSVKSKFNQAYFGKPVAAAQDDLFAKTNPSTEQPRTSSLDKDWSDSSVRSYLLEKGSDAFIAPPESVVPKNAPVIIVDGICDHKLPSVPDCQTIVTRANFEAMENAVDPGAATNGLKRMAEQYAELLVRGGKGRQLGLEDTPRYKLALSFVKMDSRFKMFNNLLLERSRQLTDADLAEFYRENPRLFEEIKVLRLVIPQYKVFPREKGKPTPEQMAAGHEEMKKEAESIAARAALPGADFQALENEGWKFSGYVEDPPEVAQPSMLRWETWPLTRLPIFDLKVGEVSKLIDEPNNGFYVYKILAKREVPFEEGRTYIRKRYAGVRYDDVVGRLLATITYFVNDKYFGKEAQQSAPGEPGQQHGTEKTNTPKLDIKISKKVSL